MFGTLGGPEVILILVVALIVFGPRRLPEIGKSMGKMLAEFRKASNDFKRTIDDELEAEKSREAEAARLSAAQPAAAVSEPVMAEMSIPSQPPPTEEASAPSSSAPPDAAAPAPAAAEPSPPGVAAPEEPIVSREITAAEKK